MRTVYITANAISSRLHPDDRQVAGVYAVEVAEFLPDPDAASAALDGFHSKIAVADLEDFAFRVFADAKCCEELFEAPEAEGYTREFGDVWRV